ncbi:alpha mannosidase-like protein [Mycena metata]|uniref:alpha-1,2-Mannosidase n=1 Tax=Mycena metata TaxID=1033252 RepID=A0AAD7KBM3_9AGAR|nr:alpha mannosidase-like protein [Mycena metata]
MKWRQRWPESLVALLLVALPGSHCLSNASVSPLSSNGWTKERKVAVREKTRNLWYHGFDNYMNFAFPLDELAPLSCTGQGPDWDHPANYAANDVNGNFSLTLVDVLDTLVVLGDRPGFEKAVKNVIEWVSFDVNTRPQVFETTIRVLGGLLSGHIFANQTGQPFFLPWYRGELLTMAHDLGKRLLPAFATPTGLPYARINLRRGVLKGEGIETCSAGAGSLMLEFATLSRLTGDDRFEKAAYKAFFAIWNRRSDIGLVGNTINIRTGAWTTPEVSGIAVANFECLSCSFSLCIGDVEFLDVWDDLYASIMRYSRAPDGFWYRPVHMLNGETAYFTVDSLSAFWPGLQVLAGDVQNYNLWRKHSGLPEVYDTNFKQATSHQYPLRPEFIESTWYLYRATGDTFYLDVAERVLFDITTRAKVPCGLAGIKDLRTNSRDDRMESFALSETLKYLFLIFDEDNPLHKDDSNYVFTTEGHLLTLGPKHRKPTSRARRKMRKIDNHQCPAYHPFSQSSGLTMGIRSRGDVDYARELLSQPPSDVDQELWSESGWCERPHVNLFAYDFVLSSSGKHVTEDLSPSRLKLDVVDNGFIIHNVTGIRIHIVQRLDGKGYDVRKLGHYDVRSGHTVFINDSSIFSPDPFDDAIEAPRALDIPLRFFTDSTNVQLQTQPGIPDLLNMMDVLTSGYTALFGPELGIDDPPLRINNPSGVPIYRDDRNTLGCLPYEEHFQDAVLLVHRGECTFLEKLLMARDAGAAGVLVIANEDTPLNPTADAQDLEAAGDLGDVGLIVLPSAVGQLVNDMLDSTEERGGQAMLQLDPEHLLVPSAGPISSEQEKRQPEKTPKILYLNGHALLNTRIVV